MQEKTKGEFFMQRLRISSAGSWLTSSWIIPHPSLSGAPSLALLLPLLTSGPDLRAWPACWVSVEFLLTPIPRKGSSSTTTGTINCRRVFCWFCSCFFGNNLCTKLNSLVFVYSISILRSRESDGGAIYFGRILTRLGVSDLYCKFSGWFFDFFPVNLLLVRSQQARQPK